MMNIKIAQRLFVFLMVLFLGASSAFGMLDNAFQQGANFIGSLKDAAMPKAAKDEVISFVVKGEDIACQTDPDQEFLLLKQELISDKERFENERCLNEKLHQEEISEFIKQQDLIQQKLVERNQKLAAKLREMGQLEARILEYEQSNVALKAKHEGALKDVREQYQTVVNQKTKLASDFQEFKNSSKQFLQASEQASQQAARRNIIATAIVSPVGVISVMTGVKYLWKKHDMDNKPVVKRAKAGFAWVGNKATSAQNRVTARYKKTTAPVQATLKVSAAAEKKA